MTRATTTEGDAQSPGITAERGQAMILIAAIAVALVGMLAIVVDTGYLYSEQRKMQAAADAAAMAGAQNWLSASSQLNVGPAVSDARSYATYNGYTNTVSASNGAWAPAANDGVFVSVPPSTGVYSNSMQYVEVIIAKPVRTFFSGIFNVSSVQVVARAVARGMTGSIDATIIALSTGVAAITTSGSSTTNVYGNIYSAGGIKCNSGNVQVYQGGAYASGSMGSNCLSGQLRADNGLYSGAPQVYDPKWSSSEALAPAGPGGDWSSVGQPIGADGWIHVPAGTYNSIAVQPGANVKFDGGVYHLIGAGGNPALDIQGNVLSVSAVQFVLEGGAIHFESQATGTLSSGAAYNNILIYSKRDDGGTSVQITGGAALAYNGSIYAPGGNVAISGDSSAIINGQVIANTVTFGGSSGTAVSWDSGKAPVIVAPALVQ